MTYQGGVHGDPDDIVGVEDYGDYNDFLDANFPEPKAATKKNAKSKTDKGKETEKDKKPTKPIVPRYEGFMISVLDPITPDQNAPWVRARKAVMPIESQELYDKAVAHQKKTGLGISGQFQSLGPNQRAIVNRLVSEKNISEKDSNAEWVLFGVKKMYEERRTWSKTLRVNNAMRVTIKRQDRTTNTVAPMGTSGTGAPYHDDEIIDLTQPQKAPKKETTSKEKDGKTGKASGKTGKTGKTGTKNKAKGAAAEAFPESQQWGDWQPEDQEPMDWPTSDPAQAPYQQKPPNPWDMPEMSGAIPVPPHQQDPNIPPHVPMAPPQHHFPQQQQHQQPPNVFQPHPHIPQPDGLPFDHLDDRTPREPSPYGHPFSARRASHSRHASHSRPREEPDRHHRRGSSDSDRLRRLEAEIKLNQADLKLNQERSDQKMDDLVHMMRNAAANERVRGWSGISPMSTESSRSTAQDDVWSHGSSGSRRGYTPASSPDRYSRPSGSLHKSPGRTGYRGERRRQYKNDNYVMEPGSSYRRGRDPGREPRYVPDDYPRMPPQLRQPERPAMQRRVTDFQEGLPRADYGRSRRDSVDYMKVNARRRPAYDEHRRHGGLYSP